MIRHASLASGTPTALETNGTVREARGLASSTYSSPECTAYCTFSSPTTPIASASSRVAERTCSSISSPSECGGKTHALAPECTPASSTCCMIPPIHTSAPSHSASTSTSVAFSRNRSRKMDGEEERERLRRGEGTVAGQATGVAIRFGGRLAAEIVREALARVHDLHRPAAEHVGRAHEQRIAELPGPLESPPPADRGH